MNQETIKKIKEILPDFTGKISFNTKIILLREKNKRMELFIPMINTAKHSDPEYQRLGNEIKLLNAGIIEICDDLIQHEKNHF